MISLLFLSACSTGLGVRMTMTSQQIADGTAAGVAALPYYACAEIPLETLNAALVERGAPVTLEDTYRYAFEMDWNSIQPHAVSGQRFYNMQSPSFYFQKLLKAFGVGDAENYIITNITTEWKRGMYLMAVIYRPQSQITVLDKFDGKSIRIYKTTDKGFYQPFRTDYYGRQLDKIIDWSVVPSDSTTQRQHQAVFYTLAANSILNYRSRADYWEAETRWLAGEYAAVALEQDTRVARSMHLDEGFIAYRKKMGQIEKNIVF